MENLILVIHLLTAVSIIALVLLQQGKGAEMGASFGSGASQTIFGSGGSGNFFSRLTAVFATVFFVTSFSLAVVSQKGTEGSDIPMPSVQQTQTPDAGESEIPSAEEAPAESAGSDIPAAEESAPMSEAPAAPESEIPAAESGAEATESNAE